MSCFSDYSQLPCPDSDSFRIQYLPEQEKAQIQNFCNWIEDNPETSTQSAPNSPIIGLIECSDTTACQEVGTSGTAKESAHEAEKSAPIAEQILPSAAASGGEAGGSGRSTVRVVPFQSLPSSTQEELGKKLFDDPLLTVENIQKLADYMQWSFKFTKVCLLLSSAFLYRVVLISDLSFFGLIGCCQPVFL